MVETDRITENSAFEDEVTAKHRAHAVRAASLTKNHSSKTETEPKKSDVIISLAITLL